MTGINDVTTLRRRLGAALPRMAALAAQYPGDTWLESIAVQLRYVDGEAAAGKRRLDRFDELNFGLLASHYVDGVDPALAEELHALSDAVRRLFGGG
ncbi:MAG TPA: hypothetical protein PKZ97_19365 [Azospirillaceae bacterium]|nr:hypothetical protein [Azospirillaceae bacterium]